MNDTVRGEVHLRTLPSSCLTEKMGFRGDVGPETESTHIPATPIITNANTTKLEFTFHMQRGVNTVLSRGRGDASRDVEESPVTFVDYLLGRHVQRDDSLEKYPV